MHDDNALLSAIGGRREPEMPEGGWPIWYDAALMAGRLAEHLGWPAQIDHDSDLGRACVFLDAQWRRARVAGSSGQLQPLDNLSRALRLSAAEWQLLVLTGMAEEHEGYAAAFSALHPRSEPWPTVGLFARMVFDGINRAQCWQVLACSPLLRLGLVRLAGDVPLPEQSLRLADRLWPALNGLAAWPAGVAPLDMPAACHCDNWVSEPEARRAIGWLNQPVACLVWLHGSPGAQQQRACQIVDSLAVKARTFNAAGLDSDSLGALLGHCLARRALPVLLCDGALFPNEIRARLEAYPLPVLLAGANAASVALLRMPVLTLLGPPLSRQAQCTFLRNGVPRVAAHAAELAARFPLPPEAVAWVRKDSELVADRNGDVSLDDALVALKTRLATPGDSHVRRVLPRAGWDDLVLPADALKQLQDAVNRLPLQMRVLDEWGFDRGEQGRRGLRMLFCGLPGTGKTLAAEVVAHALRADLVVVDLARVVSKWIGETEKNLATVFEQAEASRAVLFFDEADALFSRRTEVSDARDRYANLETAFLLARLELFDGVAVLATNLRQHLDKAFLRRFEAIVDFPEPGAGERAGIWRRHLPASAPLGPDVDLDWLAAQYPMSGAMIRNALLSAAYFAAANGGEIGLGHLERAIRLEFEKSGRLCPQ